jgi:hypothetical protein
MITRIVWCIFALIVLAAPACDDGRASAACGAEACDAECQGDGYAGGVCQEDGSCSCVGGDGDADADSDSDADADADADADGDGFEPTPGTEAAVDRTEPCDPSVDVEPKYAPQDGTTVRYCFPNYNVWAPLECGNIWDLDPECGQSGCSSSVCFSGETAKWVSGGASDGACACFNLCTDQADGARCGAADERPCIAIDDADGDQVFICGAEL